MTAPGSVVPAAVPAVAVPGAEEATSLGLPLARNLTQARWLEIGRGLARAERRLPWMIADWAVYGAGRWGDTYSMLIETTGFAYQTARNMASVARAFQLSRRRDNLSFSHHAEVAVLEPGDQDALLDRAAEEGWPQRKLRTEVARLKRAARVIALSEAAPLTGEPGSYAVVYADPAWKMAGGESDRSASTHYPVMTEDEIAALPVGDLAAPDAVLYLWATAACLEQALRILAVWGFSYSTHIVWDKVLSSTAYRVRGRHELLLIGKRGGLPGPAPGTQPESVIAIRRAGHSEKPAEFRDLIERAYPGLSKIELFARGTLPPGWDGWGNQYAPSPGRAIGGGRC